MAVNPDELDDITATVAALYREAETALVRLIARHLAGDMDRDMQSPAWAERKLAAVGALRRSAQAVIAGLQADSSGAVRAAAAQAFRAGWDSALAELPEKWFPRSGLGDATRQAVTDELPGFAAVEAMAAAVHTDIGIRSRNILRDVLDVYRSVITAATARTVTGVQTRREASQAAWRRFMDRGITGFVDRAGRRWQLSSYVEMAVRTVTQRAAVTGQTDRLDALGVKLVMVSNAPQECELCRPFEGRVLRLDAGPTGEITVPHQLTDAPFTVDVEATLADAQLLGLFHPNCRHSVSAYLPGVSKPAPQPTADPEGDKARQHQRAIERKIRRHKVREQGALDEPSRKAARRQVAAAQAELRAHLEEHPNLKRLRYREQIGAGNIPPKGRGDAAGGIGPDVQPTLDGGSAVRAPRAPRVDESTNDPSTPIAQDPDQLSLDDVREPVDLTVLTDEQLDAAFAEASEVDDADALDAVLAEMDRRQADADEGQADEVDPAQAEQWEHYERLVDAGWDEQEAFAEAFNRDAERVRREEAIARLRGEGYKGRSLDELARAAWRDEVYRRYIAAEEATRGHLVTPEAQRRGVDPLTLFTGPAHVARANASDELKEWWDEHGRMTYDQWLDGLLGRGPGFTGTAGDGWLR